MSPKNNYNSLKMWVNTLVTISSKVVTERRSFEESFPKLLNSNKKITFSEVRNSRLTKSSYDTKLNKMRSHFQLLTRNFLRNLFFE